MTRSQKIVWRPYELHTLLSAAEVRAVSSLVKPETVQDGRHFRVAFRNAQDEHVASIALAAIRAHTMALAAEKEERQPPLADRIRALLAQGEQLTPAEIAAVTGNHPKAVSNCLAVLERRGHAVRQPYVRPYVWSAA